MAEYHRAAFRQEWWEDVKKYLEEHPEEGFEPGEVKQFIKVVINQFMNDKFQTFDKEKFLEELEEELKD